MPGTGDFTRQQSPQSTVQDGNLSSPSYDQNSQSRIKVNLNQRDGFNNEMNATVTDAMGMTGTMDDEHHHTMQAKPTLNAPLEAV